MKKKNKAEIATNRQAFHNYEILETLEAGIVLLGTEIKSLRENGATLREAYVVIDRYEPFLKNASIAPYQFGNRYNHLEKRDRKLLLHKNEILKLKRFIEQKGLTIIPLTIYLKKGYVKVKLGVGKGKKSHDKRASIKEKEEKRLIQRTLKYKG